MRIARMARNIGSAYAGAAVNGVVLLVLTPLVIHFLGQSAYGLWVLTAAVGSYFGFLNAGSGPAGTRAVAALAGSGREREASQALGSVFRIYLVIGALACAVLILLSLTAVERLHVPADQRDAAQILLILIALNFLVSFPFGVTRSVLAGLHRFQLLNSIEIASALFRLVATAALLVAGFGLVAVGGVQLAASVAGHLARWVAIRRVVPGIHLTGGPHWGGLVPEVSYFSALSFGYESLRTLFDNADLLFLGILAGPAAVGAFGVGMTLASFVSRVLQPISGVLFPLASQMDALGQRAETARVLEVGTRVNLALSLPLLTLLVIDGEGLVRLWVGSGFAESVPILIAFALANLVIAASLTSVTLLFGSGRVGVLLAAEAVRYLLNLALAFVLFRWMGALGVALATLISVLVVDTWLILRRACPWAGLESGRILWRSIGGPVVTALPAMLLLGVWKGLAPNPTVPLLLFRCAVGLAGFALLYALSRTYREERWLMGRVWAEVTR